MAHGGFDATITFSDRRRNAPVLSDHKDQAVPEEPAFPMAVQRVINVSSVASRSSTISDGAFPWASRNRSPNRNQKPDALDWCEKSGLAIPKPP
jgi:hypothetical protein